MSSKLPLVSGTSSFAEQLQSGDTLTVNNPVNPTDAVNLQTLSLTTQSHTCGAHLIGIPIVAGATVNNLHDMLNDFSSTGRRTGGIITDAGSETINISGGTGYLKATDDDTAELVAVDWAESLGVSVPTNTTRYIGVEWNTGAPRIVVKVADTWNLDTEFYLGTVVNDYGILHINSNSWWVSDGLTNVIERFQASNIQRDERVGGLILGVTGTRNITISGGTLWYLLNEVIIGDIDTSGSDRVELYYRDSTGTWYETTDQASYPVTQYNDITQAHPNELVTLNNNYYANWWVYLLLDGTIALVYPQHEYNSASFAEAGTGPSSVPACIEELGILIGRIMFKEGVDAPVSVQSVFSYKFSVSTVTDHGNLAGLSDDDHTQYHNDTRAASWLSAGHETTYNHVNYDAAYNFLVGGSAGQVPVCDGTGVPTWTDIGLSKLVFGGTDFTLATGSSLIGTDFTASRGVVTNSTKGLITTDYLTVASGGITFSGATNFGFSVVDGGYFTSAISGYFIERTGDLSNGWILDYQDELAYGDKFGVITVTPTPGAGTTSNLFRDDRTIIEYYAVSTPGPTVILEYIPTTPILVKGNGTFALGLTFRSSSSLSNPTHILIEKKSSADADYSTAYDSDVSQVSNYGQWVSPLFTITTDLKGIKVTLTIPDPLPATFRIQRMMLYHATQAFDPWHLHVGGGTVYGDITLNTGVALKSAGNLLLVPGGSISATVVGLLGSGTIYGQNVESSGRVSTDGDRQNSRVRMWVSTTNATATTMTIAGSASNIMVIPENTIWGFRVSIIGRQTNDDYSVARYVAEGIISRNTGGNATIIDQVETYIYETDSTWTYAIDADTSNQCLRIKVTGAASNNISWFALISLEQITG